MGVKSDPAHISFSRGPPLWQDCGDAQLGEGVEGAAGESRLAPGSHAIGTLRLHISDKSKAARTHKTSDMLALVCLNLLSVYLY